MKKQSRGDRKRDGDRARNGATLGGEEERGESTGRGGSVGQGAQMGQHANEGAEEEKTGEARVLRMRREEGADQSERKVGGSEDGNESQVRRGVSGHKAK